MKHKFLAGGAEWDDECLSLKFVKPFAEMLLFLKSHKHIDIRYFLQKYSLTEFEFINLLGFAEKTSNTI